MVPDDYRSIVGDNGQIIRIIDNRIGSAWFGNSRIRLMEGRAAFFYDCPGKLRPSGFFRHWQRCFPTACSTLKRPKARGRGINPKF